MSRTLDLSPINDDFGQEVKPGDRVYFVTMSTKTLGTGFGIFEGCVNGCARIREQYTYKTEHDPKTDEDVTDWDKKRKWAETLVGPQVLYPQWREEGYKEKMAAYQQWHADARKAYEYLVVKEHVGFRARSLRNNIIFKR